jgi:hypothetical protein
MQHELLFSLYNIAEVAERPQRAEKTTGNHRYSTGNFLATRKEKREKRKEKREKRKEKRESIHASVNDVCLFSVRV